MLTQLDQTMISFLQTYLRINTAQPNPDYPSACALLQAQAERDGFLYQQVMLPSGHPVAIITYPGTDASLPSLILNHHMDVVPALNIHQWSAPPFAGTIVGDLIVGRGTQDMKGVGAVHYFAVKALKDAGIQPECTIHIVAIPDEEIGGFTGTQQFIETDIFKSMNVGYVLDEGVPSGISNTIAIKVSERKAIQIEITITGSLAHGSKLNCFNPIHELTLILNKLTTLHTGQQKESATIADGCLFSANITSLKAGVFNNNKTSLNMIPESASATVDIRIPPTIKIDDMLHTIEHILNEHKNSSYVIHAIGPEYTHTNDYHTPLYESLAQTIKDCNLQPKPLFFEATTDLRYYKALGLDGIGLTPFTTQDNIHGTNESLPVNDFIQGKNIMLQFLKNFCITKE